MSNHDFFPFVPVPQLLLFIQMDKPELIRFIFDAARSQLGTAGYQVSDHNTSRRLYILHVISPIGSEEKTWNIN